MSTDYYLVCENHNEGLFITDSKGNPPEPRHVRYFFALHPPGSCPIICKSEYPDIEFNIPDWESRAKQSDKELREYCDY